MRPLPTLRQYMTLAPKTVSFDQTLEQASDYMRKLHVRHLPVMRGGKPVGVISDRDIFLVLTFRDQEALSSKVGEAYTPDPYLASPDASLADVATQMMSHKYGSVLVMENDKLIGIFTSLDALRALADVFRKEYAQS